MPRPPASRRAALYGGGDPDQAPPGLSARILELGEELRGEGVAVGTSELLDAFAVLREVPWTEAADFKESLAAPPRWRPCARGSPRAAGWTPRGPSSTSRRCASRSPRPCAPARRR